MNTLFERFFESAPDAIVVSDSDGRIARVNAPAEVLFGYPRAELLGQALEFLLPERFRERYVAHRTAYQAHPQVRPMGAGLELLGRRKDGREFPLDIMLSPVETAEGAMVIGVVRDITERQGIEATLHRKNLEMEKAVLAKDRFLAGMSHELRTPLNAILGFTGTLLMRLPGPLTIDQEKQLRTVQGSAKHLLSLINDLLDLTRIESGSVELHPESVDCGALMQEVATTLRQLAAARGLALHVSLPPEKIVVTTDRRALHQILLNLLNNAIKFTKQGHVSLDLRRTDGFVEFVVTDTGIGIVEEDQEKLFFAFTQLDNSSTRRFEGSGLGLHLSQKLAGLIGGVITVESARERGSCFTFALEENRS